MAKLGSVPQHSAYGQSDVVVSLCSLGVVICMVLAVLGIKLRWFKKRIHFDQIPTTGSSGSDINGQVFLRRTSRNFQEQFSEPVVAQGIFRKKLDEDDIIERPKSLPPVRVRKTSTSLTTFGPPKRFTIPSTVVEEPVVIPPPPPPLPPSASSASLATLGGPGRQTSTEEKVNFAPSVEIIPNGNTPRETEPLHEEDAPISRQLSGRKQTGYTRPSDDIIAELQKLSDEVTKKEKEKDAPPEPLPRSFVPEKPREKFIKNTSRNVRPNEESQNSEDEQISPQKLSQRRLTGIFPSADEEPRNYSDLSSDNDEDDDDVFSNQKPSNKVVFQVDYAEDDRKSPSPPPPSTKSTVQPPLLFVTQVSNDDENESESSDSWSAIQRHRNLTQEINDQREVRSTEDEFHSAPPKIEHPPSPTQPDQPKPRTMRDMKRNNARNDLLLNSERDYNEI
ncbi:WASH complex subunit 3-like [Eupeodes corollae]|uniref:WASH complex subunit 3-like n=1 Tax=Eupeodes corollae TaxID=290404 RepID=UPI002490407F|nr:WASH complex subunit 3-like [Eupeodes corollae]